MSDKNFRPVFFLLSLATMAIGLSELPAKAEAERSISASSAPLDSEPIERSNSSPLQSAQGAGSMALPDLTSTQPSGLLSEQALLSEQTLLGQSTTQDPRTPRPATPYQTNPDTNPDAASPRPGSPDTTNPDTTNPGTTTPEISPEQTLPEQTLPEQAPADPTQPIPPRSTSPNETNPFPVEPGSTRPDTTPPDTTPPEPAPGRSGRDRTPPGTFTPDTSDVSPGRATRSGSSYIGVGGNIGLGDGDTALGEGSFSVFSKVGLTRNVSARPAVLVSDDPTILLPLTLDFTPSVTGATEELTDEFGRRVSPYLGAGVALSTGDDTTVDFLATAGLDVPLSSEFTATASVNATLFDNPAIGLLLGVGFNF
jgi:hypothetical protein